MQGNSKFWVRSYLNALFKKKSIQDWNLTIDHLNVQTWVISWHFDVQWCDKTRDQKSYLKLRAENCMIVVFNVTSAVCLQLSFLTVKFCVNLLHVRQAVTLVSEVLCHPACQTIFHSGSEALCRSHACQIWGKSNKLLSSFLELLDVMKLVFVNIVPHVALQNEV